MDGSTLRRRYEDVSPTRLLTATSPLPWQTAPSPYRVFAATLSRGCDSSDTWLAHVPELRTAKKLTVIFSSCVLKSVRLFVTST